MFRKGSLALLSQSRFVLKIVNQAGFYACVLREISVPTELALGHLRCRVTDMPPQPNSPSGRCLETRLLSRRVCAGRMRKKATPQDDRTPAVSLCSFFGTVGSSRCRCGAGGVWGEKRDGACYRPPFFSHHMRTRTAYPVVKGGAQFWPALYLPRT